MACISPWLCAFFLTIFGLFSSAAGSGQSSGFPIYTVDDIKGKATTYRNQGSLDIGSQYEEKCDAGWFSTDYGSCLPCECHGYSDNCLDGSGDCIDCQDNTTGKQCERCLDGYIGDVIEDHLVSCQPCPCPLTLPTNNFAISCMKKANRLRCICQENYAGPSCERCAPGYYGNPLLIGSFCKKCNCNGNSDPNLIFDDCDEITGNCHNCLRNTTGIHCERCAPGYFGDAVVAKNCTDCLCEKCGTDECDHQSGHCRCKPGVTGTLCDHCEVGYYGYSSCSGCLQCECTEASLGNYCDPLSGQCRCLPGATGRLCERCLYGFWNYGSNGCQRCQCEGHCDSVTGQCLAGPTEAPTNCSVVKCDKCIWDLLEDLELTGSSLEEVKSNILSVITGEAMSDDLDEFNITLDFFTDKLAEMERQSSLQILNIDSIKQATMNLISNLDLLSEKNNITSSMMQILDKETLETSDHANQLSGQIATIASSIQDIIVGFDKYGQTAELSPEEINKSFIRVADMLDEMRARNFSEQKPIAEEEKDEAQRLLERVLALQNVLNESINSVIEIQDNIDVYNIKLSDLKQALEDAIKSVQQTEEKNEKHVAGYQRKEQLQNVLIEHFDTVNMTLLMASESLIDTENTISELENNMTAMSEFHASIDGAHERLREKLANLSSYNKDLVLRATEYSRDLDKLALELASILKSIDTNGFIQKALTAANVYNTIVEYIAEAENNATTILNAAQRAGDAVEGIQTQSTWLRNKSETLLDKVKELSGIMVDQDEMSFNETMDRVEEAINKKNDAEQQLLNVVNQLEMIELNDAGLLLNQSKLIAEEALNTSRMVTETIAPMDDFVKLWLQNLNTSAHDSSTFNKAVSSAGDAVNDLTELVPQLLDKLRIVEQKRPANNISASILRIRELIAQTRNVASKIQVSMKFEGQSAVEVRSKSNLEELKSFTSMSLYMRVPSLNEYGQAASQDRFIMYLGNKNAKSDYIGLGIKNDNLVYVYNLGKGDVEIPLNSKPVSTWPNYFNLIKIERVGRHGKVQLTVPSPGSTAEQKFIQKGVAEGNDSLLNLEPENLVFYVGGVPPDFQLPVSLNLSAFIGCVELSTLNNDIISLYNFKQLHNLNTTTLRPCTRHKLAFAQSRAANFYFDGSGYAFVKNIERRGKFSIATRFNLDIRTPADSALLLLMVNGDMFFSMEMQNGYIRLVYDFGFSKGPVVVEDTEKKKLINDAKYHEVSFIYHHLKKMILLIDRHNVKSVENEKKTMYFTDVYVGGAPAHILSRLKSHVAVDAGFRGCLRSFQFQRRDINLLEEEETLGISSGCPEESLMSRKAYFNGEGFISSTEKITPFSNFEGGFNFRTLQSNGLLFHYSRGSDIFSISLDNGTVMFKVKETTIQSEMEQYNDGRNHFIRASVTPLSCQLIVDDKDRKTEDCLSNYREEPSEVKMPFYFGGLPHNEHVNFTGCISNAYLSRLDKDTEVEDFQTYTEKVQTSLYGCPTETHPAAILHQSQRNSAKAKRGRSGKVGRDKTSFLKDPVALNGKLEEQYLQDDAYCYLPIKPRAIQHAYQYGGIPYSRQEFHNIPEFFSHKSHFSVSMRTRSPHGLIFYVANEDESQFMTLFAARGHLIYSFSDGNHKLKIKSQEKYNDGLWHNIIFMRTGNKGRLVIDGLQVLEDSHNSPAFALHIREPFYIGGVPLGRATKNIQVKSVQSFNGCLRNFQLNGQVLSPAIQTFGVTPCFEGPMESGTYFSADGGYMVLDDSFNLGLQFELVFEIRPRNHSGILLHVHSSNRKYLNLFMEKGKVMLKVHNGAKEFATSVTAKQSLCDGQWHRIAVIRDSNVVQLDVDSEVNHVVGPLSTHSVDSKAPVFVGGVPESLLNPRLNIRHSFTGCIKNFNINESPVIFSKAALVSGGVHINSCPAI
uniref:Laminin subunit alpha 4 n=1 Tax=Callorhinchus milii TaxID=7868 RepID=A0A4W3HA55_CALMI|eukprot:gi/632963352/ref/XP_007897834.1/ PREDICTED: laminin subunit alpha-4 [Callorhinchus milii]